MSYISINDTLSSPKQKINNDKKNKRILASLAELKDTDFNFYDKNPPNPSKYFI